jgi:hypothetical protein
MMTRVHMNNNRVRTNLVRLNQGGVELSSVKLDWAASSSSQCAAAQSITLTITALRYPGCASRPLAVWANHMRVRPDQLFAPVAAPFANERVRALDELLGNLTFRATWVTTVCALHLLSTTLTTWLHTQ